MMMVVVVRLMMMMMALMTIIIIALFKNAVYKSKYKAQPFPGYQLPKTHKQTKIRTRIIEKE